MSADLAEQLNNQLRQKCSSILPFLSQLGHKLYFPVGILEQSRQAKQLATKHNATIGIYTGSDGPVFLEETFKHFNHLKPADIYPYAPSSGRVKLRQLWADKIKKDNPSLNSHPISNPVATCGITHAVSLTADFFLERGDTMLMPDLNWENYPFMLEVKHQLKVDTFKLFNENRGFNLDAFKQKLVEALAKNDKIGLLLNFPNNPTGYSLTNDEQDKVVEILKEVVGGNKKIVVLCDDAYFGLLFEEQLAAESIFSKLANCSDNICAVKLDGATKELMAWGFRVGFITIGYKNADADSYKILEQKLGGLIRASMSNSSMPSQSIIENLLQSNYQADKDKKIAILKSRAVKLKSILETNDYHDQFDDYPFNSGYFMCLRLKRPIAEQLRVNLLQNYQVGTISFGERDLRVAFCSVKEEQLQDLFDRIYRCAKES